MNKPSPKKEVKLWDYKSNWFSTKTDSATKTRKYIDISSAGLKLPKS